MRGLFIRNNEYDACHEPLRLSVCPPRGSAAFKLANSFKNAPCHLLSEECILLQNLNLNSLFLPFIAVLKILALHAALDLD